VSATLQNHATDIDNSVVFHQAEFCLEASKKIHNTGGNMSFVKALEPGLLYTYCDATKFPFKLSTELDDLTEVIGQSRALESLRFGIKMEKDGYNLFVLGSHGMGKYTMVRQYLEQQAKTAPSPSDWCYVHNFQHPHKPVALELPTGRGVIFRRDVNHLLEDLRTSLPLAFEAKEYQARVQEIEDKFDKNRERSFFELEAKADKSHIAIMRSPSGFIFAPVKDGKPLPPEEYKKLSKEEKEKFQASIASLQKDMENFIYQVPELRRETNEKIKQLNEEVATYAVGHLIDRIKEKYKGLPAVLGYLNCFENDVIDNVEEFRHSEPATNLLGIPEDVEKVFLRYSVNLLVDNNQSTGAPVIYEDNPMYNNLVGRIEHTSRIGTLVTDFTLIKPGALHLANGGFLILDIRKLLQQPYAWESLKRALYSKQIRIQSLAELFSIISTVSLEAEPIPINLKIVLLGDRILYYLLLEYDPDFAELFKIAADFEEEIERSFENDMLYAKMIATVGKKENLLPYDAKAIARIIEYSSRRANDARKLTTHMLSIVDLMRESDQWCREVGDSVVTDNHVQRAIDAQVRRLDRLRDKIQEEIHSGTILIDTEQDTVGQVNSLSVISLGNFAFGLPTRITATTQMGDGKVIDIFREVELGGAIHSKGVLILSAFLSSRFGGERPLSFSASITFEQSYGKVEGDSASVAELCALMSVLANTPVKQSLAVTGSVNQLGQVQAIGGVNEKIEGFFYTCQKRGLTGKQGVLIPASNVKNLMLEKDVVEAAEKGEFHIYPVETIDEAISLLTGNDAGMRDESGQYPENSINKKIDDRFKALETIMTNLKKERTE